VKREWLHAGALWGYHRELWANNGDALSKIYAGTGALNTSFTRTGKRTFAGLVSDATKSVSRAYINNFQDKNKQAAIDMFLVRRAVPRLAMGGSCCAGQPERPAAGHDLRPRPRQRPCRAGEAVSEHTGQADARANPVLRTSEYSTQSECIIFVGTWNVNGKVSSSFGS
jgi:hypothetical protein